MIPTCVYVDILHRYVTIAIAIQEKKKPSTSEKTGVSFKMKKQQYTVYEPRIEFRQNKTKY